MASIARNARVCAASLAAFPIFIAGCTGGKMSPEKANAAVVVEAGASKLTGATISAWLSQAPTPPTELAAALLVSTWLDQTLLDQAVRKGVTLDDSATVDEAILPDAVRGMLLDFWEARANARPAVTDAQADSVFDSDRVRVFQQIFMPLAANLDSATAAPIAARIRSVGERARAAGADFNALLREVTTDSLTLARNGFMSPTTRADLPKQVGDAIWPLRPGEVSGILGSTGGGHIFRRATRVESRALLKQWIAPQLSLRAEQRFIDSTSAALGLTYSGDAIVRVRAMAPEPMAPIAGGAIATWKGGELSGARVRSWITTLAPNERVLLSTASDSAASRFLRELAQREILLSLASPNVPAPNPAARAALTPQYKAALDTAKSRLKEIATGKAEGEVGTAFVDAILQQRIFYRPLPGNLAGILRARATVTVNKAALDGVVSAANAAWREKHANDTAAAAPRQQGVPQLTPQGIQPAPGGVAPIAPPKP